MDSGAFTAYKTGKEIHLEEYCHFIETLKVKPWNYFTLDVFGNPAESVINYNKMLDKGLKPVPIFTTGDSLEILDKYYETADIVGLGGLTLAKNRAAYLKWVTENNKGRKTHMLGVTDLNVIRTLKPHTCDSSSWESGPRFGGVGIYLFDGTVKILRQNNIVSESIKHPKYQVCLKKLGIDNINILSEDSSWNGSDTIIRRLCGSSGVYLSQDYHHKVGTKLFLVCTNKLAVSILVDAYKKIVFRSSMDNR